ncbi:MAG: adenylate/guanylate cyclase domain-containing protein [Alphaproteobacteria bacterium]|nr:adenylate/guanylate cyclase domain-containing protein [Alphaproteobacteria bacterium]
MALKDDLETKSRSIFSSRWTKRDGYVIPTDNSVGLGNEGVEIEATVLYADLSNSTILVDGYSADFAAEVYKSYLHNAAKIIRSENGEITAYDGDRIMAVFIGDSKNSAAVRAAMKINWAVLNIINPALANTYGVDKYNVKQVVGIDTSKLLVAKTGIRGANDLVWVGRAANYAAKLSAEKSYPTFITEAVYNRLSTETKFSNNVNMWNQLRWTTMNNMTIYGSTYWWSFS